LDINAGRWVVTSGRLFFWVKLSFQIHFGSRFRVAVTRSGLAEARAAIFAWIEVFNCTRLHRTLGFKLPVDFETKLN
jgi:transposase InsO family protein